MLHFRNLWMVICALTIVFANVQSLQAQEPEPEPECVVLYPPGMAPTPPSGYGDPEILEGFEPTTVRRVLIAAHVVRRTNGTGGISSNDINTAITQLNTAYFNVMIEFVLDSTDYIDNDTYFELTRAEWASLANINVVARRLNIYFVPQAVGFNGIAYLADRRCAVTNAAAINGSTLPHEVGHNLFLYHTHGAPGHEQELVNGSNCTTAGDLICDTPAEPYNNDNGISNCVYTNTCAYFCTFRDPNNQLYNPDTRNFMGYAPANCRNRFSSQQSQKMNQTLSTILYDLLTIPVTVTNKIGTVNAGGTLTINSQVVASGGSIVLEAGVTYPGKTNHERLQGNNKHKNWDEDATQFRLQENFPARREHPARDAYFVALSPVTITTQLIETGGVGGNIQFRDPWYLADANGNQPNQFLPYGAPFSPTGAYNQSTGGVFLNQTPDPQNPNKPYYSVGAPSGQQIGDFTWNFANWTTTQGSASFQNATAAQTGVVFQSANTTVSARMKAHLASTSATATAPNNQRKIAMGQSTPRMVYASAGHIWGTYEDQYGLAAERLLSGETNPPLYIARDPSIDVDFLSGSYHLVWEELDSEVPFVHYIKYVKLNEELYPLGDIETIDTWWSNSAYRATPVIGFVGLGPNAKSLFVAWKGERGIKIVVRMLQPDLLDWGPVHDIPETDDTCLNPAIAGWVHPSISGARVSAYVVWQQDLTIRFCEVQTPDHQTIAFFRQADISTKSSNNFSPSVVAVYMPEHDWFRPIVAWHKGGNEQGPLVRNTRIVTRERSGDNWLPYKQIEHGTHTMEQAVISYDGWYFSLLGVFFQCASHVGYAHADASNGGRWDGGWGWSVVNNLAANGTSPNGIVRGGWAALWMSGAGSPYPIRYGNQGGTRPFKASEYVAARKSERGENNPNEQPQPSWRTGAVDLRTLTIAGWGENKLRGMVSYEVTPHRLIAPQDTQRLRFVPPDTLNHFADWLGTRYSIIPQNALALRAFGALTIRNFEVVEQPPRNVNPVIFRLLLKDVNGSTLGTLGEMRLKDLMKLARRDPPMSGTFTVPLVAFRGRTVSVDVKIVGQTEGYHPEFWETYFTPAEGLSPTALAHEPAASHERSVPAEFALSQNYPNPFNPGTVIRYQLPEDSYVSLKIYDVLGREVATLVEENREAGYHEAFFDASALGSGVYFCRMWAGNYTAVRKLAVVK